MEGVKDKIIQVNKQAILLFDSYISTLKQADFRPEGSTLDQILKCILNLLTDTRVGSQCFDIYKKLLELPGADFNFLASYVFKQNSFFKKNYMQSFKHLIPRLTLVKDYLTNFAVYEKKVGANRNTFPFDHLFDRLFDAANSSN